MQWQQLWQEVQPLRNSFNSGFFDGESIYAKAIKATLTPDQTAQHDRVLHDRHPLSLLGQGRPGDGAA